MAMLFQDGREQAKHVAAIQYLASVLGKPEPEIVRVYQEELGKLSAHAKVKDFLPLLVERRVKERVLDQS